MRGGSRVNKINKVNNPSPEQRLVVFLNISPYASPDTSVGSNRELTVSGFKDWCWWYQTGVSSTEGLRILVSFLPIQGLSSLGGVAMVAGSRRWLVTWYLQSGSRETRAHVQLSPFYSFGAMVCGMMPPTVRMDCLSSVQSF
jgi:hypothetical protein